MVSPRRLVFVYDIDAAPVSLCKHLAAGMTTGQTRCHLFDLTFGRLLLKHRSWRRFVGDLALEVDFELRSTFCKRPNVPAGATFPAVFLDAPAGLVELISSRELNAAPDLDALRELVSTAVVGLAR